MPTWFITLEIEFKEPVRFVTKKDRKWLLRPKASAGFYQNFGVTADSIIEAKQMLVQKVTNDHPYLNDNMKIAFEQIRAWTVEFAQQRLKTDFKKIKKGDPTENGIWLASGRLLYPAPTFWTKIKAHLARQPGDS